MTVLLTGGAGYIGSHVAVELLQSGYDVIIADNFYNSSQEVPERIRKITGKSVRTYNVDIQNSAFLTFSGSLVSSKVIFNPFVKNAISLNLFSRTSYS